MSILRLSNIHKSFGDTKAVEGLFINIPKECCLAILGPSGCGKTTALRLIAGFEQPDLGELFIDEKQIANPKFSLAPFERNIGMVFQDLALWPHMTVEENIALALKSKKMNKIDRAARIIEVLGLVHLPPGLNER